jgi:hypothetical protein
MAGPERAYGSNECGTCRLWRPILADARGPIGPCRLNVRTGDFPGTAPRCERYLGVDAAIPAPAREQRSARRPQAAGPVVRRAGVDGHGGHDGGGAGTAVDIPEEILSMTREEFAQAIREVLREESQPVPLAPKWEGGTMVLKPRDAQLQAKEIGLDQLFHKIVMIRDRLRVLEQKINASDKLTDAEKVDMQTYVTRCYGSLTTFNILFRDERDRFVGEKGPA